MTNAEKLAQMIEPLSELAAEFTVEVSIDAGTSTFVPETERLGVDPKTAG